MQLPHLRLLAVVALVLTAIALPCAARDEDEVVVTSTSDKRVTRNKNGDTLIEKLLNGRVVSRTLPNGTEDELTYDTSGRQIKCIRTLGDKIDIFEDIYDSRGVCYAHKHNDKIEWLLVKDKKGRKALAYYGQNGKLLEIEYTDDSKRIIDSELGKFLREEGKELGFEPDIRADTSPAAPSLEPGETLPPFVSGIPLCPNHIQGSMADGPSIVYAVNFGSDRVEPAKAPGTTPPWVFQSEEILWTYTGLVATPTGSSLTISTSKPALVKVKATRIQKYKDQNGTEGKSETHSTEKEVCVLKIEFGEVK